MQRSCSNTEGKQSGDACPGHSAEKRKAATQDDSKPSARLDQQQQQQLNVIGNYDRDTLTIMEVDQAKDITARRQETNQDGETDDGDSIIFSLDSNTLKLIENDRNKLECFQKQLDEEIIKVGAANDVKKLVKLAAFHCRNATSPQIC